MARTVVRRHRARARGIAARRSPKPDIALRSSRPSWHFVPLLIRWPKALLEAVDAEVARRVAAKKKTYRWRSNPVTRAEVIRALVADKLGVDEMGKKRIVLVLPKRKKR